MKGAAGVGSVASWRAASALSDFSMESPAIATSPLGSRRFRARRPVDGPQHGVHVRRWPLAKQHVLRAPGSRSVQREGHVLSGRCEREGVPSDCARHRQRRPRTRQPQQLPHAISVLFAGESDTWQQRHHSKRDGRSPCGQTGTRFNEGVVDPVGVPISGHVRSAHAHVDVGLRLAAVVRVAPGDPLLLKLGVWRESDLPRRRWSAADARRRRVDGEYRCFPRVPVRDGHRPG